MGDGKLRSAASNLLGIIVFSAFHCAIGVALAALAASLRLTKVNNAIENIALVWWSPGIQIFRHFHFKSVLVNSALLPGATSLLWGASLFALWKWRYKRHFSFSLRALLIGATIMAVLLGTISYITRNYLS